MFYQFSELKINFIRSRLLNAVESQPTKTADGVEKENLRRELLPRRQ